ncbi:hypothetical protein L228DRAFT_240971 [Xylona heveae TC161]|uniref:Uncharacterized protein n=1 Tax=Xylona heveae (strain CBS 132557 / TC161) TaxID=1328760 RepID=A0A165AGX4_XYLHT|nr:hypothetical protein L228DRAFT_240971 [Xylona heveae TC161]KZF20452.1 hypothetical protein L228DRAFT_240971 [Xylona heveae TC161]
MDRYKPISTREAPTKPPKETERNLSLLRCGKTFSMIPPSVPYTSNIAVSVALYDIDRDSLGDQTKAFAAGILNHYFKGEDSYLVASEQERESHKIDFLILKVPYGRKSFHDHTFVVSKRYTESWESTLDQLSQSAAKTINAAPYDRTFAIAIRGWEIVFCEYHVTFREPPPDSYRNKLLPIAPSGYEEWQIWNLKNPDHVPVIDDLFRQLQSSDVPPKR